MNVVHLETQNAVATVTMNNPPVNAIDLAFLRDFERVITHMIRERIRAAVFTSACPLFFSAGTDISAIDQVDERLLSDLPRAHALLGAIEALPFPTIAAINGQALSGGLELALCCDFRFMGDQSERIGLPAVRMGLMPALGATQRLPQIVGRSKAIEMMYKGLMLSPEEAADIGLINAVVPQAEVLSHCHSYATRLSRQATGAIACIKRSLNVGLRDGVAHGMKAERDAYRETVNSADAREGVLAFLTNRAPKFRG